MTKKQLALRVYSRLPLDLKSIDLATIERILNASNLEIMNALAEGERIDQRGFGAFFLKTQKEKKARVITRGESIIIPERKVPCFKPSPDFKAAVRANKQQPSLNNESNNSTPTDFKNN